MNISKQGGRKLWKVMFCMTEICCLSPKIEHRWAKIQAIAGKMTSSLEVKAFLSLSFYRFCISQAT
jgi:hypothetical protein